jgi:hypothetical protein
MHCSRRCDIRMYLTLTPHFAKLKHRVVLLWSAGAAQRDTAFFIGPLHFQQKEVAMDVAVPCPDRIRSIPQQFAWIDRRLRDQCYLGTMNLKELAVYLFLILAANKNGVSFYRSEQIAAIFDYQLQPNDILQCRNNLFDKEFIAFLPFNGHSAEGFFQVLPLPAKATPLIVQYQKRGGEIESIGDIINNNRFGDR